MMNEIFRSIQFEGALSGTPALFIRFQGCNLHCPYCDTLYAREGKGWPLNGAGLVNVIEKSDPLKLIVFTGGEPTIQPLVDEFLLPFSESLKKTDHIFAVETNGTRYNVIKHVRGALPRTWITFSPKVLENWKETYAPMWALADEIKVVHESLPDDLLEHIEEEHNERGVPIFLQPMEQGGKIDWEPVTTFVQENPQWRMSFQTHKILGLP